MQCMPAVSREGYAGLPEKGDDDSEDSAAPSSSSPGETQSAAGQQEVSMAGAQAAAEGEKGSQPEATGAAARERLQAGPSPLGASGTGPVREPDKHGPGDG